MNFKVQSVNFDADKKLLELIGGKLKKLDRFREYIIDGEVILRVDNKHKKTENKVVEIRLSVKKNSLFVRENAKTFEKCLDLAINALLSQIRKYKEKLTA